MKIVKVLGTGCANCRNTIKLIDDVAKAKGVEVQLEKVEGIQDIMTYGVMSTPGRPAPRSRAGCRRRAVNTSGGERP